MKNPNSNDRFQEIKETGLARYSYRLQNLKLSLKHLESIDDSNFSWDELHENLDSMDIIKEEIARIEKEIKLMN